MGYETCNAPIKGLYELGVEIEENSELDLLVSYKAHAGDARIPAVCEDMKKEMGEGRYYADMLERMAQFELTLLDWAEGHKGARKYVAFADKCWPAFPEQFGFEPCYVNSRLASRGIPVACEVDIYGALSEYIGACISHDAVTLLDINNSVPASLYEAEIKGKFDYTLTDTFMGFHCGKNCLRIHIDIAEDRTDVDFLGNELDHVVRDHVVRRHADKDDHAARAGEVDGLLGRELVAGGLKRPYRRRGPQSACRSLPQRSPRGHSQRGSRRASSPLQDGRGSRRRR